MGLVAGREDGHVLLLSEDHGHFFGAVDGLVGVAGV